MAKYLPQDLYAHPRWRGRLDQITFATDLGGGGPIAMAFDPYETSTSLYYTTFANGGEVRRIVYTGD